ncbi:MAG: 23S rRNA (adenine(2503)-C(2))-methyltransferase RlmN [Alphaproteobacteria bacterium]|nr:23S rRNA (adenine(2503)-C(2))-methyltransferase RlmN [Alphaproteobacteria bacterium]
MNLIGLSKEELTAEVVNMGEQAFRAKQLWHWIYWQGKTDFNDMTSLAKDFRQKLIEKGYTLDRPKVVRELTATDKTRKWLFQFTDQREVETVYIPEEDRGAVCISTQVGCPNDCKFCHTGSQKFTRNLTAGEIVGQFMAARDSYDEWPSPSIEPRYLSNIVVMGMGEPLLNYENTKKALKIIMDPEGIAISKRRITLSTSGVVPLIDKIASDLDVKLAVSLHAPTNEIRDKIMPINHKYPLKELMVACKKFQDIAGTRNYITMEYVMLDGINDSPADAHELMRLVSGLAVKFNLIPFNEWPGCPFKCSPMSKIKKFAAILEAHHYAAPIRVSRGQEIMAACGQLKSGIQKI